MLLSPESQENFRRILVISWKYAHVDVLPTLISQDVLVRIEIGKPERTIPLQDDRYGHVLPRRHLADSIMRYIPD